MKRLLAIYCILFVSHIQSQDFKTLELLPPESKEYSDLHFLDNELQGKNLVMLGEMTHMYGNIFEMKARVVEYLHKELGYTTIAMESSMYDLWLMNKKDFTPKNFNNNIWSVWSDTKEFQRLVNYIDNNNIKVIGFDSQFNNNTTKFIESFIDYLGNNGIDIKLNTDDLAIVIEGVLVGYSFDETDIKFSVFEKELNRIINVISKLETTEQNYYWLQLSKNILTCSKDIFYNKEEIQTTDLGNSNHNFRDAQMADNILSYMRRNPNEKVICWADNIHIINDISSIKKPIIKDFISMGTHIKKELKNKVYSLATIHANDSLLERTTWHKTPIAKGSFEDKLKSINEPYLFVSSNQEAMMAPQQSRLLDFVDFTEMRLDQLHDGYIFFENATVPKNKLKTLDERISNKKLLATERVKLISKGKSFILKGQIVDSETNTSIPYTNVIMKKEEIYRVADDNGSFELPITNKMLENGSVSISSMGYESRVIQLKNLTSKIQLSPKYEELDEIVITGYLSPKTVLTKAVKLIDVNHPNDLHNHNRYGNVVINRNDETILDLEVITKDCDQGYDSPFVITQRMEQVKWNKNSSKKKYKYSAQFFSYRQNAIRYANILHKRKYKKFELNFIKSKNPTDKDYYIIEFKTDRNKWNYTNRSYPTEYSGKVYINKEDFAVIKVIENWKTTLNRAEIEKYFKHNKNYKNIKEVIKKEENICSYLKVIDNKYYASKYFNRIYIEKLSNTNTSDISVSERNSNLYDVETNDVEKIESVYYNKKESSLSRVEYSPEFWDSFYKQYPTFLNE